MKVLHVTLSFHHGGRREAILRLIHGLDTLGVESHLCCLDEIGADIDADVAGLSSVICLGRRGLFDRQAMQRLRGYCAAHRIDILHTHDAASQFLCALAMRLHAPPLLMSFHRSRDLESATLHDRLRNALVGLRTRAVVTASHARQKHYLQRNWIARRKVLCIPLGVDTDRFAPSAAQRARIRAQLHMGEHEMLVGVAGHFGPDKGVDIAIDAFRRMLGRHPELEARLLVLGTGNPEQKAFIEAHLQPPLADRIHLAGFQSHPEQWFPALDLFLHGARRESFGLVLIEAMACAVPVLAPASGGMLDIIEDGRTGRLVPPGDIDAMAQTLAAMLSSPRLLEDMAGRARQRVLEMYTEKLYAEHFKTLYEQLLSP